MRNRLFAPALLLYLASPAFAVDGVLEINQTCAVNTGCFPGDSAGFPVTISGFPPETSYRLTSNLSVSDANADGLLLNGQHITARPPDAMLLDYRLRDGVTGIDVANQVNAALEHPVPTAIVTGETTPGVLEEIRASGLAHLTKPVAPFKLRAMLMEMLRA